MEQPTATSLSVADFQSLGLNIRRRTIPSGNIAYIDEGDGPPIVLLHGAPLTSLGFVRVVRSLRSRHRVIAPDLPGFGQSHAASTFAGTLAAYVTSVREFCESLDLRRFVMFGCDAGACVGLAAAAAMCPLIAGLVIANTVPIPLTGRAWVIKIVLRHVVTSLPMRFLNRRLNLLPWLVATVDPHRRPFSASERAVLTGEPEPLSLADTGISRIEALDTISMAFLVLLQRLTPAERAVLLLHEVFDFGHHEIATLLGKTPLACRQLLKRAREQVGAERRSLSVSPEAHQRLLRAFVRAAGSGDLSEITTLLAEDVVLIVDTGAEGGTYGRVRSLPGPVMGATKVAAFVAAVAPQGASDLVIQECELNGLPGMLVLRNGSPYTAILLSVQDDRINGIFMHADVVRLNHVGAPR